MEGVLRFDLERDQALREAMRKERARLTARMNGAQGGGGEGGKKRPTEQVESHYHCDTLTDENR